MLHITVVYSPAPRVVDERVLQIAEGSTVRDALVASGLLQAFPELALSPPRVGVWGHKASLDQALRDRDRVEAYRPLLVDPKVARRERFRKQGSRGTGLFARDKAGKGGKAG